jgi:hypothetical protein
LDNPIKKSDVDSTWPHAQLEESNRFRISWKFILNLVCKIWLNRVPL